jgi:hypothetical protein
MKRLAVLAVVALAIAVLNAAPAQALSTTTFVSGNGLDTNPCTHTAPCRSFAAAVLVTSPGGQVTMLDPAGYGPVTITHAISIVNDGDGEAGINDPGATEDAIMINAGPSDVINLRGLTLNGVGTGRFGIDFTSGGALNIQNCVIRDFSDGGVSATLSATGVFIMSDTIVAHNGVVGIFLQAAAVGSTADLRRVAVIGNAGDGIDLIAGNTANLRGAIADSVAAGNGGSGFNFGAGVGGVFAVINSQALRNGTGLAASSTTYISQTTLAGNSLGFFAASGALQTFGDNYIIDTNNSGSLTPIAEQ